MTSSGHLLRCSVADTYSNKYLSLLKGAFYHFGQLIWVTRSSFLTFTMIYTNYHLNRIFTIILIALYISFLITGILFLKNPSHKNSKIIEAGGTLFLLGLFIERSMPLTLDPVSRASKWLKPKNKVKSWRDFLVGELTEAIAQIPYVEPREFRV